MIKTPLILLILAYRYLIRPMLLPSCRYYPSCSEYALQAMEHHGGIKGTYLTLHRLCRCHPGCEGGIDLVPQGNSSKRKES